VGFFGQPTIIFDVGSEGTGKFTGKFSETRHFGLVLVLPTIGNSAGFRENSLLVRTGEFCCTFCLEQGICREFVNLRKPANPKCRARHSPLGGRAQIRERGSDQ
jgi:hypothetical protein